SHGGDTVPGQILVALFEVLLERAIRARITAELNADLADVVKDPEIRHELVNALELGQRERVVTLLVELDGVPEAARRLLPCVGVRALGGSGRRGRRCGLCAGRQSQTEDEECDREGVSAPVHAQGLAKGFERSSGLGFLPGGLGAEAAPAGRGARRVPPRAPPPASADFAAVTAAVGAGTAPAVAALGISRCS